MPAIDPTRLARELDALAQLVQDPEEATRTCLKMLDFYADRTRRPTLASTADLDRRFGVPGPVQRALSHRLALAARDLPDQGQHLADVLWQAGYRETRQAAAALFETRTDPYVAAWVEDHGRGCIDMVVLRQLGVQSLKSWRAAHPDLFLARIWSWFDSPGEPLLMALALLALNEAVRQPQFGVGPEVFQGLEARQDALAAQPRRAVGDLLRSLAVRSPAETAQFLKDHLKRAGGQKSLSAVIRTALPEFPSRQRRALEAALSAKETG
jgi:hypothetical protein